MLSETLYQNAKLLAKPLRPAVAFPDFTAGKVAAGGIRIRGYHRLCAEHTAAARLYSVLVHYLQLTKLTLRDDPIAICYQNTRLVEVEEEGRRKNERRDDSSDEERGRSQTQSAALVPFIFFIFYSRFVIVSEVVSEIFQPPVGCCFQDVTVLYSKSNCCSRTV